MPLFDQDKSQTVSPQSFKTEVKDTRTCTHSQCDPVDSLLCVNETESRAYETRARLHIIMKSTERKIQQQLSDVQRNIINSHYINVNYIFV